MRTITILALGLTALTHAPAVAQEQVTVVKRDGTRFSGRFEAWNRFNNNVYVRVTPGDQRIVPMSDVQVIDVGGSADNLPAAETEVAQGSDHVMVLATGEIVRGRLINIEGGEGTDTPNEPRIVSFQPTSGNERRARMSEIRRLYMGNYPRPAAPAPSPEPALPPGAIRVPATAAWVSTGVTIRRGDRALFEASGEVQLSGDPEDKAGTAGSYRGRQAQGSPLPQAPVGALIGRVGTSAPFAIGNMTTPLPMPGEGELFLTVNDDEQRDNQGAFTVVVRVVRGR
jgi:hypothetical protein